MTTQEIREMLDSTITANGKREISGQSLNASLNAMVDVLEEGIQPKISTDVVLDRNSNNPIANSAVATAIEDTSNAIKDVSEAVEEVANDIEVVANSAVRTHTDLKNSIDGLSNDIDSIRKEIGAGEILMFDMSSGGTKLREYFTEYDLANKLDTPIACLVKFNSFEKATVATVVVEGFDASGRMDGTEMYKITFATLGFKTKATSWYDNEDGTTYYIPQYVWSANCLISGGQTKSYLYTPSTTIIQGLGDGTIYNIPQGALIYKHNLNYDKLQFGRTYYVFVRDESNPYVRTLDSILVSVELFDAESHLIGIGWVNIKDGAFDVVHSWM
jgi:hypothetical protein